MFTTFAPAAVESVTRALWAPSRRRHGRFYFGGCLFWILFGFVVLAWFGLKLAAYVVACAGIMAAQLFTWLGQGLYFGARALVRALRHPAPSGVERRWDAR